MLDLGSGRRHGNALFLKLVPYAKTAVSKLVFQFRLLNEQVGLTLRRFAQASAFAVGDIC